MVDRPTAAASSAPTPSSWDAVADATRRMMAETLREQANDPAVRQAPPRTVTEARRRLEMAQAEIAAMEAFIAERKAT